MTDHQRLRSTLGAPGLEWLVARARDRIARGLPLTGTVVRKSATIVEREALARFIGRPVIAGDSASVSLDDVDRLLRANGITDGGLAEAVVTLGGPVAIRHDEASRLREEWSAAHEPLRVLGESHPRWMPWVENAEERGTLRRRTSVASEARLLASEASRVLERLPASGIALAVFANEVLGDSHALDTGRPVASLVLAAIRFLDPEQAFAARQLWESVGVALDELSSTVLVLALPYSSPAQSGTTVLPHYLTLQQLDRLNLFDDDLSGVEIFVCENPSVVAAAARIGSPPLVCLRGQPSAATVRLLTQLSAAGATFRYHGDFDWGGIRIANGLFRRFGFSPWRFRAPDYERIVSKGSTPLLGKPVRADWDGSLTEAMTEFGIKIEEEAVLNDLILDLSEVGRGAK
ncbi:MAG: TIGR02679 family protein [Microbacteriaceae bacterium]